MWNLKSSDETEQSNSCAAGTANSNLRFEILSRPITILTQAQDLTDSSWSNWSNLKSKSLRQNKTLIKSRIPILIRYKNLVSWQSEATNLAQSRCNRDLAAAGGANSGGSSGEFNIFKSSSGKIGVGLLVGLLCGFNVFVIVGSAVLTMLSHRDENR